MRYSVLFIVVLALALVTSNREDSNFANLTEQIGKISNEVKQMVDKPYVQLVTEPPLKPIIKRKKLKSKVKIIEQPQITKVPNSEWKSPF